MSGQDNSNTSSPTVVIHAKANGPPETAHLVARIPEAKNIGATMEASARAQIRNGQEFLSSTSLREVPEPMDLIINGQLIVTSEVTKEDIEKGLGKLWFNGQMLYPEHLAGPIESRVVQFNGQSRSYRDCTRLFTRSVVLDGPTLRSLPENSAVVVLQHLRAYEALPPDEVTRRISMLQVLGKFTTREEHAEALLAVLDHGITPTKIEIIPAGHEVVTETAVLDRPRLKSLAHRKLYFLGDVRIQADVGAELLGTSIESAVVRGTLYCPADLQDAVAGLCDLSGVTAIFHEGTLWLEEESATIAPSRFEYLEGNATLVVQGTVTISPDIEPGTLASRLDRVHNFGVIRCTEEQMGAIQARLGTNEGKITNPRENEGAADEGKPKSRDEIGNVGGLKL